MILILDKVHIITISQHQNSLVLKKNNVTEYRWQNYTEMIDNNWNTYLVYFCLHVKPIKALEKKKK